MIKNMGIMGANYLSNAKLPLLYLADITAVAAQELEKIGKGQNIRYIVSDYISAAEVNDPQLIFYNNTCFPGRMIC